MNNDKVDALLNPRNVVLVGASDRARHWSARVWNNLKRFDFPGPVFPVNPNREEIWGARCYPALDALPEAPDHVILFVPADVSLDLLETAAGLGARSATIYAAGFGEGDEARGRERERRLKSVIAATGLAVSGPNCMGNVAGPARLVTLVDDSLARVGPGPVAVVTQSGAMCLMINRTLADRGIEAGHLISCGNQTGINTADYIRYFAADAATKVILSYLELVVDRDGYLDACSKARDAGKPVITVKAGASEAGRAAAMAHTGSLVGSIQAFDAVTAATGVIRFDAIEDAIEAVEYFTHLAAPKGGGVFVMTNSGALKALVADATSRLGIALPAPETATVDKLREILGDRPGLENPLDSMGTLTVDRYVGCLEALAGDANFDMLLIGEEFPQNEGIQRKVDNLTAIETWAAGADMPVVLFTPLVEGASDYARQFRNTLSHLPILHETDKTLRVIKAITEFATRPAVTPVKSGPITPIAALDDAKGAKALDEVASRGVLEAYGIACVEARLTFDAASAVAAADAIGYPVVAKAVSAQIAHKTEAGAVMTGLMDADAVRNAYDAIPNNVLAHAPDAALAGILVARQMSGGLELALGIHHDAEMGPVVMFGAGGVLVELIGDVAVGPPLMDETEARAMIARTRVGKLLAGDRSGAAHDLQAVVAAVTALGRLAHDHGDRIESIDVNPFYVMPVGQGAVALDALVVLR